MGALGHYIEDEGIATTGISLVREHTEDLRPPRFLWVPFELGRPLGAPNQPDFQREVLRKSLLLLESNSGPVLIEDFDEEAPIGEDRSNENVEGWACPVNFPSPPSDKSEREAALLAEIESLSPWYDFSVRKRGGIICWGKPALYETNCDIFYKVFRWKSGKPTTRDKFRKLFKNCI